MSYGPQHEPQRVADAIVRDEAQRLRFLEFEREALPQSVVQRRIARGVLDIRKHERILYGNARRFMDIKVTAGKAAATSAAAGTVHRLRRGVGFGFAHRSPIGRDLCLSRSPAGTADHGLFRGI